VYAEWEDRGDKPRSEKQPDAVTLITTESAAGVYACGRPAVTRQCLGLTMARVKMGVADTCRYVTACCM